MEGLRYFTRDGRDDPKGTDNTGKDQIVKGMSSLDTGTLRSVARERGDAPVSYRCAGAIDSQGCFCRGRSIPPPWLRYEPTTTDCATSLPLTGSCELATSEQLPVASTSNASWVQLPTTSLSSSQPSSARRSPRESRGTPRTQAFASHAPPRLTPRPRKPCFATAIPASSSGIVISEMFRRPDTRCVIWDRISKHSSVRGDERLPFYVEV